VRRASRRSPAATSADRTATSLRLAYVDFDGEAALAACAPGDELDESWLRRAAPRVQEAVERIVSFIA
jgi:hypothetical protein